MEIGDRVTITGTNSFWDNKTGVIESIEDDKAIVFVDFIPKDNKKVRQDFSMSNLKTENDVDEDYVKHLGNDFYGLKEDVDDESNKSLIRELARFFACEIEDVVQENEHEFEIEGNTYWIGTEVEAREKAIENARENIEELGLDAFSDRYRDYVIRNFLDTDTIEDWMRESYQGYVEDIEYESDSLFENRLIQEMYDANILSDEDFELDEEGEVDYLTLKDSVDLESKKEDFVEYLVDNDEPMSWLKSMYDEKGLIKLVNDEGLLDVDAVAEDCVDTDGVSHFIAQYDGNEHQINDELVAYRIN